MTREEFSRFLLGQGGEARSIDAAPPPKPVVGAEPSGEVFVQGGAHGGHDYWARVGAADVATLAKIAQQRRGPIDVGTADAVQTWKRTAKWRVHPDGKVEAYGETAPPVTTAPEAEAVAATRAKEEAAATAAREKEEARDRAIDTQQETIAALQRDLKRFTLGLPPLATY